MTCARVWIVHDESATQWPLSTIELYNSINQYASIWISGNRAETLSDADFVVYSNLVRMLNESTYVDYSQQTRMGEPTVVVMMRDFAAFLHQNPGARRHWLDMEDNAIAYRNRLAPGGMDVSFWRDAIVADLTRLDQGAGQALPDAGAVQASVPG
jgi:hypothetical protein